MAMILETGKQFIR